MGTSSTVRRPTRHSLGRCHVEGRNTSTPSLHAATRLGFTQIGPARSSQRFRPIPGSVTGRLLGLLLHLPLNGRRSRDGP